MVFLCVKPVNKILMINIILNVLQAGCSEGVRGQEVAEGAVAGL